MSQSKKSQKQKTEFEEATYQSPDITGKVFDKEAYIRLYKYVKPYRKAFYASGALAVLLAFLAPARPKLIQITVDQFIFSHNFTGLIWMTILLVTLLMMEVLCQYGFFYLTNWVGQSVIRDLRQKIFGHILSLKLRFFDQTPIGRLTTRTINDIEAINRIFSRGLVRMVGDMLTLITVITLMLLTNWKLTLVSLATLPLMFLATYVFQVKVKSAFQDVRYQVSRMNAFLQEHITGMKIVQIFGREDEELERFKNIDYDYTDANLRAVWYYSIFFPVVEVIVATSIGLLIWWGGNLILANEITPGTIIAFILYINMLFRPIRLLADRFNTLQMGIVASERVFNILDTQTKIENKGTHQPEKIKGKVDFDNVWFAYDNEEFVLKDISFHINPGETAALVGATGAGKSSIINILSRFYEYNQGEILIDDVNIRDYDVQTLRSHLGVVLQDVFLFSGTVADNISLKNPNIPRSMIEEAAKEVGAHEFIMRLRDEYDHDVMERGSSLSLGQRQLIAFLRALVYDPSILVLDEATSAVDTESEILIQKAIERLVQDRSSIIIAHRLSTIQHADKIIVIDKGKIKEKGTHQELMKKEGHYHKLYKLQFESGALT